MFEAGYYLRAFCRFKPCFAAIVLFERVQFADVEVAAGFQNGSKFANTGCRSSICSNTKLKPTRS